MEKQERKILIEVSQEEYEKIKAGILEKDIPTYEDVKKDFVEEISEEDIKALLEKHSFDILENVVDDVLIGEIIRRTKERSSSDVQRIEYCDPMSAQDYVVVKGELEHLEKKDNSQIGEPVITSNDVFSWTIKIVLNESLKEKRNTKYEI